MSMQPEAEGSAVRVRHSSHYRMRRVPKSGRSSGVRIFSFLDSEKRSIVCFVRFPLSICKESIFIVKGEVTMKKFIAAAAAAFITCSAMSVTAFAEENSADIFVSVIDAESKVAVAQEAVTVTDIDSDGKLTVNDALVITHDKFFEGGSEAGYKTVETQYGDSIDKLWGVENGGSYGYYINNNIAMGLTDELKSGDYLNAFIYPDPNGWATTFYSWFDKNNTEANEGDEIEVTLKRASFDENYQLVPVAVEGAAVTVNGEATDVKTDAEGKAKIKLDKAGRNVISAGSIEGMTLISPVLIADVKAAETTTTTTEAATTTTTTTTTATTTASTSTAKSTAAAGTASPKTGDTGAAVSLVLLGTGVFAAFSLRKKHEN